MWLFRRRALNLSRVTSPIMRGAVIMNGKDEDMRPAAPGSLTPGRT